MDQFSDDKIYFHTTKLRDVMKKKVVALVVYELSLSGICNCKCKYCCCKEYQSPQMLSRKDIDLLAEQLRSSALAVTITGGGEPLTNPEFSYCLYKLRKSGLSIGVITNGLLLNKESIDAIVRCADFCRISLDTVKREKYKELRGIDIDIKKIENDLKLLSSRKKDLNSEVLIGTQIVYIDQSMKDIENTILFSKTVNVDFIQIRPVDNIPRTQMLRNYQFYINHRSELEKLVTKYSDDTFKVILNENKFEEYYSEKVKKIYSSCLGANFTASIGHDMNLYFCCAHIGNPLFYIGNLKENKLMTLLFSDKRKALIEHPMFEYCQIQCRNHKNNKLLNQLSKLEADKCDELIQMKSSKPTPQHYKFL